MTNHYDILVIGGGINGAGIARDAAGRGLKVLLCDKADLGGATSWASTKLIHGGLRYLEQHEFRLVREALKERDILLRIAPHIIWPMRFVLPHNKAIRPAWMIRAGLFLYDLIGGKSVLQKSRFVRLDKSPYNDLKPEWKKGFVYSDCGVKDSRLVILNAMDARNHGAVIMPYTELVSAHRMQHHWQAELKSGGQIHSVTSKAVVNATGPWVTSVLGRIEGGKKRDIRLVKGSHIVVPKLFDHDHSYIFQQDDGRVVFAIPYEQEFTLIGTTEEDYQGDPAQADMSQDEMDYMCRAVNRYFRKQLSAKDIIWSYSGVRPLVDDDSAVASRVSRDYELELDDVDGLPLLNVFGGKITTYRKLAGQVMDKLSGYFDYKCGSWTGQKPLPGGDMANPAEYFGELREKYNWLPEGVLHRYAYNYGTLSEKILSDKTDTEDMGTNFGDGVFEAELDYLVNNEWASDINSIIRNRTKLALHISERTKEKIATWLERK